MVNYKFTLMVLAMNFNYPGMLTSCGWVVVQFSVCCVLCITCSTEQEVLLCWSTYGNGTGEWGLWVPIHGTANVRVPLWCRCHTSVCH